MLGDSIVAAILTTVRRSTFRKSEVDIIASIEGQISINEAKALMVLAANVPSEAVIVEIGTYRGRSAVALALGARQGSGNRVYAIDPHVEFKGILGGTFGPSDQAALYSNLSRAGVGDLVAVVSLPSDRVGDSWQQRNIGLLWIDGDHSYEGVSLDYSSWIPFLLPDAIVAFHDSSTPEVQRLIQERIVNAEIWSEGNIDAISWFRLRE